MISSPGPQRGDAKLLHRPAFLLPYHRERGGEHGGEHQDEADQAGDEELRGLQLGVEADARLVVDARRLEARPAGSGERAARRWRSATSVEA